MSIEAAETEWPVSLLMKIENIKIEDFLPNIKCMHVPDYGPSIPTIKLWILVFPYSDCFQSLPLHTDPLTKHFSSLMFP